MNTIRKADLNIITAQWSGMISRTFLPAARTHAVIASADPVALDYHAAKYILHPNSACRRLDPDWRDGPLFEYLYRCAETTGYALDEKNIDVISYDFRTKKNQARDALKVIGDIDWGKDPKMLAKYALFRFLI